ncbi:hypothetical protein BGX34_008374 [Mortierella sp. NVP85]|nr:hypothetical protein BGX34_008374 [Mortierella sp. NVP85]
MVLESKLPLPDECIDHIVAYLVDQRQALHALLLSSQKLFQRAAPILYRSPFLLIESSRRWTKDEKKKRSTSLLALLLTSKVAPESEERPSSLVWSSSSTSTLATVDYLRFYTFQYQVELTQLLLNLRTIESDHYLLNYSSKTLDDVSLELIKYCPENIRVIGQPLARTPMLVPLVDKFRNLVRLELSEFPTVYNIDPIIDFIRVHDQRYKKLKEIKIKGFEDQRYLEPSHKGLVEIVQVMKTAQVVDARHWREATLVLNRIPVECLKTLLLSMADMPPNNISAADYLRRCRLLEELRMPVRDDRLFAWAVAERRAELDRHAAAGALSRSRSLPPPVTTSGVPGTSFHPNPGVATPVSSSSSLLSPSSVSGSLSSLSLASPWHNHHLDRPDMEEPQVPRLVRLKSLDLLGEDGCLVPALKHAVDAFRDSLEILRATSHATTMLTTSYSSHLSLTWQWPMTRLSVLELDGEVASSFDFETLDCCPALTTLRLSLPTYMYSSNEDDHTLEEMKNKVSRICKAKRLRVLELGGKWPISDQLLKKMTEEMRQLTTVSIVECVGYTVKGVHTLIGNLKNLERLTIRRWVASPSLLQQMIQALSPRLELIEE